MFELALIEHKLDKDTYKREEPLLRTALLEAQAALIEKKPFSVVILVTGMDGAGKGAVIHRLLEWLDPRHVRVEAFGAPDDAERMRPPLWRYWRTLPAKGSMSIVFGSWYSEPLRRHLGGDSGKSRFERELAAINRFEEMLTDEGVLVLKFLLVLSGKEQKKRLDAFAKRTGGASRALEEWADVSRRKQVRPILEEFVRRTSTAFAPWVVVPSDDAEYRDLTFGRTILETLRGRLAGTTVRASAPVPAVIPNVDRRNALDGLDLTLKLDEADYKERAEAAQIRLLELESGQEVSGPRAGRRVRGTRCRRQRRRDPSHQPSARPTQLPRLPDRGSHRRGEGAPVSVAILAPCAAPRVTSRCSIAPGTAACWSSASKASPASRNGAAPTARSTILRRS